MKKFRNVVWEGRFQPFHRGHCEYVRRLLDYGERVWIYVVANEVSTEVVEDPSRLPVPEFTRAVDPHHAPSKNVLPLWLRCLIVERAVASEFGPDAPISVSSGRRLDLDWAYYEKNLPPDRVFLTPLRDSFEDVKAASWQKLGERCERLDVSDLPRISATMIRERLASGADVSDLLPPVVKELLEEFGYLERLMAASALA